MVQDLENVQYVHLETLGMQLNNFKNMSKFTIKICYIIANFGLNLRKGHTLTVKSAFLVSRVETARTNPGRHSHSEILLTLCFPSLFTDKNRFPTSSSRIL